jgi:hypothetical protein
MQMKAYVSAMPPNNSCLQNISNPYCVVANRHHLLKRKYKNKHTDELIYANNNSVCYLEITK